MAAAKKKTRKPRELTFKQIDSSLRVEIFSHLDEALQVDIVGTLRRDEIAHLLADMSPDDRADLFKQLPESLREAVLPALAQAEREDIRRLAAYEEGTAGAVMTSDYATLPPHLTASQAITCGKLLPTRRRSITPTWSMIGANSSGSSPLRTLFWPRARSGSTTS